MLGTISLVKSSGACSFIPYCAIAQRGEQIAVTQMYTLLHARYSGLDN